MMLNLLTQSANDGKMMTVTMMSDILKVSKAAISQSINQIVNLTAYFSKHKGFEEKKLG